MNATFLEIMLLPIARFCVRRSIKLQQFLPAFKKCLVQAANEELDRLGVSATGAKLHAMTGVHRKDVKEYTEEDAISSVKQNPIIRIIGQWQTHSKFTTKGGQPRTLSFSGNDSEFKELVDSVHCDENHYALLFELERNGLVSRTGRGIKLAVRHYLSLDEKQEAVSFLAEELDDLIQCVENNSFTEDAEKHLQLKTAFDNIPARFKPELKKWLVTEGSKFHSRVRNHLAKYDCDSNPKIKEEGERIRMTLSTFSIAQQIDAQGGSDD